MSKYLLLLVFLAGCSSPRSSLDMECFDKSGKLVYKETRKYITIWATDKPSDKHKCVVTELK